MTSVSTSTPTDALGVERASHLSSLFKVLANDTRLRLVHALVEAGELSVGDLAGMLGMTSQAISNQLQRLVDRNIVAARRDGNRIYYRVIDPCVRGLLEEGLCLIDRDATAGN